MKKKVIIIILSLLLVLCVGALFYSGYKIYQTLSYYKRLEEIMNDDKEIERKWLIKKEDIPYNLKDSNVKVFDIKQTYLCFDPEMRVRDYNNGESYEYTIKTNMTKDGLIRDEVNIDINKEQYDNLIIKQEGNTIHKTRYQFYDNKQLIAIDIFHDDLDGLAYMEIEFSTKKESDNYKDPKWVIKDVTDDINYKNGHLARFGIPK
jgi:CYTH domain-containing protein